MIISLYLLISLHRSNLEPERLRLSDANHLEVLRTNLDLLNPAFAMLWNAHFFRLKWDASDHSLIS